jgi:TupA-like ATPgrasp
MRSWWRWLRRIRRIQRAYKQHMARPLHLFRPRRFTEKMQWRKLYDLDPIYAVFCDKIATREYVAQRLGSNAIVPMLWFGRDPDEVPFETLRPPYIIKCSHGSGWNIVVRDSDTQDRAAMRGQLGSWLASDFGMMLTEPGYSAVPPRLLVEPLLTYQGGFPIEWKFFMFNGITRFVLLRTNYGDLGRERRHAYYDAQGRLLPLRVLDVPHNTNPVPRPPEFETMRVMAESLAKDRDHIRVDFLVSDGHVYVGELTCYHQSGMTRFEPDKMDFALGQWWQLKHPFLRALWTVMTRDWIIRSHQQI